MNIRPETRVLTLINKQLFSPDIGEFTFQLDTPCQWKPGQFFMSTLKEDPLIRRAYSISSSNADSNQCSIIVKKVPEGKGSTVLFEELQVGDSISAMMPFGHLCPPEISEHLILLGTGIGVTPLLGIIQSLADTGFTYPVTLYYGVRHCSEILYEAQLTEMSKNHENFTFHLYVSQPEIDTHEYNIGRIDSILDNISFLQTSNILMCGSPTVTKHLKEALLSLSVDPTQITIEAF